MADTNEDSKSGDISENPRIDARHVYRSVRRELRSNIGNLVLLRTYYDHLLAGFVYDVNGLTVTLSTRARGNYPLTRKKDPAGRWIYTMYGAESLHDYSLRDVAKCEFVKPIPAPYRGDD